MLDIFTDNPVLVVIIIFVIVRLLRGNKNKVKKPEDARSRPTGQGARSRVEQLQGLNEVVERQRSSARGERATRLGDLKAALEDAVREADRQFSSGSSRTPVGSGDDLSTEAPPALPASPSADPYAFHSLMNREEQRVTDTSRIDYDTTAVDYDARSEAFNFRSSSREPAEQEYHLTGFKKFKSAGGLTTDPVKVRAVGDEGSVEDKSDPLQIALADPDQLRRAFILHEILERPVSLRRR